MADNIIGSIAGPFVPTHHAGDLVPADMFTVTPPHGVTRAYFNGDVELRGDGPPYRLRFYSRAMASYGAAIIIELAWPEPEGFACSGRGLVAENLSEDVDGMIAYFKHAPEAENVDHWRITGLDEIAEASDA